jgi:hypothetical protein
MQMRDLAIMLSQRKTKPGRGRDRAAGDPPWELAS